MSVDVSEVGSVRLGVSKGWGPWGGGGVSVCGGVGFK